MANTTNLNLAQNATTTTFLDSVTTNPNANNILIDNAFGANPSTLNGVNKKIVPNLNERVISNYGGICRSDTFNYTLTADVWTALLCGSYNTESLKGFTYQNNGQLKCLQLGIYLISYSIGLYAMSDYGIIDTGIMLNNIIQNIAQSTIGTTISGNNIRSTTNASGILTLNVNDTISIGLRQEGSGYAPNFFCPNFTVIRVG
ncbi:MAG TPA: hypothetical protein VIK86_03505 [Candidatus Paceibacterota bacterium]